jgi:nucleoside 2-deoxyribosyltransferase
MKVYLAGPLFTPYERSFLADVAARIRAMGIDVFVPHEQAFPEPIDAEIVFAKDSTGLVPANAVVALLDGPMVDDGTACEIGMFYGLKENDPTKVGVVGLLTDTRFVGSHGRTIEGRGVNLFVLGCIERMGLVTSSVDDVVDTLVRWRDELASADRSGT